MLGQEERPLRIACVGDSITYGSTVEDREQNHYPRVLDKLLGESAETRNFGISGATLLKKGDNPYWELDAFEEATAYEPDVVVIKLGTNDSKPRNWEHKAEFEADLAAMIDHFANLSSEPKIWVCLPAPVYESRWGISDEVVKGEIIPIVEKVAAEKGVPTIDIYHALSGRPDWFPDHVHPNADGAAVMAVTIYNALRGKLQE